MRFFIITVCVFMLLACNDDSPAKQSCEPSEGLFNCIALNDFSDFQGQSTTTSQDIASCTIIEYIDEVCPLAALNFIANDANLTLNDEKPSKQNILDKLIVSAPWMANNFSLLLDAMPDDLYRLFGSVTAIVIHHNIRPAFFLPATGAIYLDPEFLWISESDKIQLSNVEDYRVSFDKDLNYITAYRYSNAGNFAFNSFASSRTIEQALHALSALLFHELAHARDYFPLSVVAGANIQLNPYLMKTDIGYTSDLLKNSAPLTNSTLFDIADVKFRGITASDYIKSLNASQVATLFDSDNANDEYNYSDLAEDVAMLFEEAMMRQHYNIDRELAFLTPLVSSPQYCEDYSWDYSVINRFSENNVISRVSLVVNDLLPVNSSADFLNTFSQGTFTWCQPLIIPLLRQNDIHFSHTISQTRLPRH